MAKIPGIYVAEQNAFPNSVVLVETAIPVFIGYTETAVRDTTSLKGMPTRISSLQGNIPAYLVKVISMYLHWIRQVL